MRVIRQHPVFALSVIASIAIGVSVTAGLLAMVESIRLGVVPFTNADRIEALFIPADGHGGTPGWTMSPDVMRPLSARSDVVESVGAYVVEDATLQGADQTQWVRTIAATVSLPSLIGTRMWLGRSFNATDANGPPLAMVSHAVWTAQLGGDSSIVGRTINLGGTPHVVVGVIAPGAAFPNEERIWTSDLTHRPATLRNHEEVSVMVLLRPGVNRARARGALAAVATIALADAEGDRHPPRVASMSFRAFLSNPVEHEVAFLSVLAAFVALVSAVNFAGLLLARGLRRRTELGVRSALGASIPQLVTHILGECAGLCAIGGVIGALAAPLLVAAAARGIPDLMPTWATLSIGWGTVTGSVLVALVVGMVFGISPALDLARPALGGFAHPGQAIQGQTRAAARSRSSLVALQVALASSVLIALTTLVGEGIVMTSPPVGFAYEKILAGRPQYRKGTDRGADIASLLTTVRETPGVVSATAVGVGRYSNIDVFAPNGRLDRSGRVAHLTSIEMTTGFFSTTGIRLVRGRLPSPAEETSRARVAVVSRALVEQLATSEPLGWRIHLDDTPVTIIGVVDDVRWRGSDAAPTPLVMSPMREGTPALLSPIEIWTRVTGPPATTIRGLTASIDARGGGIRYESIAPLWERFESERRTARTLTRFALGIVGVALFLAGLGLYGMVAYAAEARTLELAIREALGASRRQVAGIALSSAARQAALGVAGGAVLGCVAVALLVPRVGEYAKPALVASICAMLFVTVTTLLAAIGPLRALWRRDLSSAMRAP